MIDNKTTLNLVIGNPLSHTKSPILHNTIYRLIQENAVLLALETKNLNATLQALNTLSVGLTAVTMPYKQEIIPYLNHLSEEVEVLQAANTIIRRDDQLSGFNTDIDGIAFALAPISISNKNVLVIGAGGAARAAAFFLKKNKANLFWLNRTPIHAYALIEKWGGTFTDLQSIHDYDIDIIINTTPVGMSPHVSATPLPHYHFKSTQVVFDMIYNPLETLLIQQATAKHAHCISGIDMFIGQGIKQVELWLNKSILTADLVMTVKKELYRSLNVMREFA